MNTAAVVVNWNSGEALERCLKSLRHTAHLDDIIVVDNASTDNSLTLARDNTHVRFLENAENRGFAAGVNQGVRATQSSFVLVLNPDVEASDGAISELVHFLQRTSRAGAVGGNVNSRYLPRRLATPVSLVLENLGLGGHASHPSQNEAMAEVNREQTEVEQAAAAAILIRREAFDEIGGFDERFHPAWYEDVDFCRRLRMAGWTVHFLASARFIHEGGYSARALGRSLFLAAFYRNQLRYVRKHFGLAAAVLVRGSIIAGMFGRMIVDPVHAGAYAKVMLGAAGAW